MLGWMAVLSGVGLVVVLVRWKRTPPNVFGHPPPAPWWAAGSLAVLCLVTGTVALRNHHREGRLSGVASTLAGHPVTVDCQSWLGSFFDSNTEAGYVRWEAGGPPERSTTLKADVCRSLGRYMRSAADPSMDEVFAVHIVSHEAMHMAGVMDEALAECAAVQRDIQTARLLGATSSEAAALAERYWIEGYPLLPDEYRTSDCRPGGPLDEGLAGSLWSDAVAH